MIKAVFFDLYHTLVTYHPPREQTEAEALREVGINIDPGALCRPIATADEFLYQAMARRPLRERSAKERADLFAAHQATLLREAGIKAAPGLAARLSARVTRVKAGLVLFEDVLPSLAHLREKHLALGLISNVDRDIAGLLREVGMPALDIVVTSQEVGFSKPQPEIFLAALGKAGVKADEALYVGDQYQVDIVGARSAGIKGILLDRHGYHADTDAVRITGLAELTEHLG